jgi:hypothetical protein
MSKPHLDAWMSSRSPDEGAEAQAIGAFLTVLKHKAVLEGADLDRLDQIAESGKSERHRLRAAQLLGGWRQRAADALANATAIKEQVMDAKGLSKAGTQVGVFDFTGMSLEKLKALAEGKPLLPEKAIDASIETPPA